MEKVREKAGMGDVEKVMRENEREKVGEQGI